MKRVSLLLAVVLLSMATVVHAADFRIFDLRNKIFDESKAIKTLLPTSKDHYLLMVFFDSCIVVTSQIDAYFCMMGIFNALRTEDITKEAVGYLVNWLTEMKRSNEINLKSFGEIKIPMVPATAMHFTKLKSYFGSLGELIQADLNRMNALLRVAKPAKTKK